MVVMKKKTHGLVGSTRRPVARRVFLELPLITVEVIDESGRPVIEPVVCYKLDDWSIPQYVANALHLRRMRHDVQYCHSLERQEKFVSGSWRSAGTILRAELRGHPAAA